MFFVSFFFILVFIFKWINNRTNENKKLLDDAQMNSNFVIALFYSAFSF
jgi:hypothetical protein